LGPQLLYSLGVDGKDAARDPEVQASAVLTIGSLLWKIVSAISNVTFLVSIRQESFAAMFQFFESTGWWLLMALGVGWLLVRITHPNPTQRTTPGWSMVGVLSMIAFLFGALLAARSAGGVPDVIVQWGASLQTCQFTLDTSRLVPFQDKYRIAAVCGLNDPNMEKLDDNRISVSNLFEIVPPGITILDTVGPEMRTAMQAYQPNAAPLWYEAVLVPVGVDRNRIATLRDLIRMGGKIIRSQYWNLK